MIGKFVVMDKAISFEKCDELNEKIINKVVAEEGKVGTTNTQIADSEARNSTIRWLNNTHQELYFEVYDLIRNQFMFANRIHFGLDISGGTVDIQHSEYKENQHYSSWHMDTCFHPSGTALQRKLSMSIQLSDKDSYEGGDLEFAEKEMNDSPISIREKGTVIIFPSFLAHRVTPVTKGVRHSLVTWCEGTAWK